MKAQKAILLILALMAAPLFAHLDGTRCTHDEREHNPQFLDIEEDFPATAEERRMLTSYSNLRTYGYYETLNTAPSSYKSYIENDLAPPVLAYFAATLKVKYPVSGPLKVSSSTSDLCGITTPSILYSGVDADYFIFYQSEVDTTSNWVADSTPCFLATGSKRPLIVTTLLNRNLLKETTDVLLHEKNTYLLLHEMTHTLGFSYSLYKYFLDESGNQRSGHIKSATLDGATSVVIDVDPLTSRLKSFFGCLSLKGAYMENSGSTATAGSHFERRQYVFEAMTSGLIYQQSYSQFSLAMLEGSGWYVPDYTFADPYYYGEGQGCSFLTGSCSSANANFEEFCDVSARKCTFQGRGGGTCGSDTRSDECKFIFPNVDYDCENPDAESYARLPDLQVFGREAGSKCFSGTLSSSQTSTSSSYCFKYTCSGSGSDTVLSVKVGSQSVQCNSAGTVSVPGYEGHIDCPDPMTYCNTIGKAYCPRNCMGRGECVNNQCVCYSGFTGKDCALNA